MLDNIDELDIGFSEEDRVIDARGGVGMAECAGLLIKQWLKNNSKELNPETKLLGLGAGSAVPELALAQYFAISDDRITLVEKQPLPDILEPLKTDHPGVNFHYGEGLFHFLKTTEEKYDLVTCFLLEHIYKDPTRMRAFIDLLSQKMRPGGIVCVWPYEGEDLSEAWNDNGFVPFYPEEQLYDSYDCLFYYFKGKEGGEVPLGHTNLVKEFLNQGQKLAVNSILDDEEFLEVYPFYRAGTDDPYNRRLFLGLDLLKRFNRLAELTTVINTERGVRVLEEVLAASGLNQPEQIKIVGETICLKLLNEDPDKFHHGFYVEKAIDRTWENDQREWGEQKETKELLLVSEAFINGAREALAGLVSQSGTEFNVLPNSYKAVILGFLLDRLKTAKPSAPNFIFEMSRRLTQNAYSRFYYEFLRYVIFSKAAEELKDTNPVLAANIKKKIEGATYSWSGWENFTDEELKNFIKRVNAKALEQVEEQKKRESPTVSEVSLSLEKRELLNLARQLYETVTKAFQEQIDLDKLVEITRRIRSFESIDMKTRLFGECLKHGFLADDKLREIYERGELSRGQGYLYRLLTQTRVVIDNLTGGEEISLVNLTIVAEDAIKIQRSYDEKKIELKQPDFLDKDRFLLLVGKRVEWDLIFMNFLDNALKAVGAVSELRHGLVDIDFFVDPKKEILLITVEDNGVGIPQELLKSGAIFQRVSGFEKQGIGGTGVGLPHVKEIIESYAGEIKIESQEGVGTKIIIKLPLRT